MSSLKSKDITQARYIIITGRYYDIRKFEDVTEIYVLQGFFLSEMVVDSNCMGMDKGTDHDVNFDECTSASLELVLPSRYCHPVRLLGSVLLCHHLLLLCWASSEPVCHPQVSNLPSWNLVRIHCLLPKPVSNVLH